MAKMQGFQADTSVKMRCAASLPLCGMCSSLA